jgi:hypothetical protein
MAASAQQMVTLIRTALAANPIGVVTVTVDGQTVEYDRRQALDELKFWQTEAAKESGRRPRSMSINLSGF